MELSGGSDAWLDGARFAGALSVHYQDLVSVSHTTIRDNHGDDGLSIKYAAGTVTDSLFMGNRDDHECSTPVVEVGPVLFQISRKKMMGCGRCGRSISSISTASCATAGSRVRRAATRTVDGSRSARLARRRRQQRTDWRRRQGGECGRGERGAVRLESCRPLVHSAIGVAVKDLSSAYLHDNRFEENRRDVRRLFEEAAFFGGGRVVLAGTGPRQAGLSVDIRPIVPRESARISATAVERLDPTGMRPERVVESLGALSAASEGR